MVHTGGYAAEQKPNHLFLADEVISGIINMFTIISFRLTSVAFHGSLLKEITQQTYFY